MPLVAEFKYEIRMLLLRLFILKIVRRRLILGRFDVSGLNKNYRIFEYFRLSEDE